MEIVEAPLFTKRITELMTDSTYRELQEALIGRPDQGEVIPGSGGLRKIRWGLSGKGKRGGIRVIYFWAVEHHQLCMLYAYSKARQEDLDSHQLTALSKAMKGWFDG